MSPCSTFQREPCMRHSPSHAAPSENGLSQPAPDNDVRRGRGLTSHWSEGAATLMTALGRKETFQLLAALGRELTRAPNGTQRPGRGFLSSAQRPERLAHILR